METFPMCYVFKKMRLCIKKMSNTYDVIDIDFKITVIMCHLSVSFELIGNIFQKVSQDLLHQMVYSSNQLVWLYFLKREEQEVISALYIHIIRKTHPPTPSNMSHGNFNQRNPQSRTMILLVTCLLVALLPSNVRAGDRPCSFCPRGVMLPDPNKIIALSPTASKSCGELQEDASNEYLVKARGCDYYKYYAHLCGCPPRNLPERCGLCQGGGGPTYDNGYGYQTDPPAPDTDDSYGYQTAPPAPPAPATDDSYDDDEFYPPLYPEDPFYPQEQNQPFPHHPLDPPPLPFYPGDTVSRKGGKKGETSHPTSSPSGAPSSLPSGAPSSLPSSLPSGAPSSLAPSGAPSKSNAPPANCKAWAIEAMYDPFNLGCGHYYFLGTQCGCPYNKPRPDGCPLCVSGADPAYGPYQLDLPDVKGTCQEIADYTAFSLREGSAECISRQATLGNYCGCDADTYFGQLQPKPLCPLCPADDPYSHEKWVLTNEKAPSFSYLNPDDGTIMYQSGATCLQAEMLANELLLEAIREGDEDDSHQICYGFQEQLTRECCKKVPKKEYSPSMAPSLNPSTAPSSCPSTAPSTAPSPYKHGRGKASRAQSYGQSAESYTTTAPSSWESTRAWKTSSVESHNLNASAAPSSSWKSTSSVMFLSAMIATSTIILASVPW